MRRLPCLVVVVSVALFAGCGGDDGGGTDSVCSNDDRGVEYEPGIVAAGADSVLDISLDVADPTPPNLGENDWTLTVWKQGVELDGCTLTVVPFMPDHNHGSNEPTSTPTGQTGQYFVEGIRFIMAGYWETLVEVECDSGDEDRAELRFCIDG